MTTRMNRSRSRFGNWPCALATVAVVGLMAAPVGAAPIPVDNPSFEDPPAGGLPNGCGAGCSYSVDFIPGWTNTPNLGLGLTSGQFRPGAGNTAYFDSLSDGPTSAYTSTSCIAQTVGATVQEGVTYTLLVDVGWRKDASPTGLPRLRVNDIYYDGIGTPVLGGWATFTATYVGLAQDAGLPITICLESVSNQGNFDDVRLNDSTEPTGIDDAGPPPGLRLEARPVPFQTVTRVRFSLVRSSPVVLRVFDASGRAVRTLLHAATLGAGAHEATWDGRDAAGRRSIPGVYFLRIETNEGTRVERIVMLR